MGLGITTIFIGKQPFLPLTREEHDAIATAWRRLYASLYVQEKYVYLIENYYELELSLLESNVREMHFPDLPRAESLDAIHLFLRRIANVLTTSRLYVDHTQHDLKSIDPSESLSADFKGRLSASYDASFAYRLCENLRNYLQHRGIPLSGITRRARALRPQSPDRCLQHYIGLQLATQSLATHDGIQKAVRTELQGMSGEEIDLRPLLREYVFLLASVHEWLEPQLATVVQESSSMIADAIQRFRSATEVTGTRGIVLVDESGNPRTGLHLLSDPADRFVRLTKRYVGLSKFQDHFVTSAPPPDHDAGF